ncbi:hypothetical protein ACIBG8_50430 [Nonomuraea sp. NPDC050556]|uniref:hypothetical protein n=1 Tax=Nonomuraea sp. NPDC050556 TaxID=3364369 RepID=UPI003796D3DD
MKRLVLAWLATAVAATAAAVAVLGLLGGSLTGASGRVMTQEEARAALGSAPALASGAPAPANGTPKAFRTAGGTVIASCHDGLVQVRSASPAQGYAVDDPDTDPDDKVKVEFEADEGEDVELELGCANGEPVMLPR